jgi:hypothetical protein
MQTGRHIAGRRSRAATRRGFLRGAILLFLAPWASHVAAESLPLSSSPVILLLVEDPGCPYCARWDRDVGSAYSRSPEGQFAPLVRRFRGSRDVGFLAGIAFSPTFVVVKEGREIGRIVGYSGPDFFWSDLSPLLMKAGFPPGKN